MVSTAAVFCFSTLSSFDAWTFRSALQVKVGGIRQGATVAAGINSSRGYSSSPQSLDTVLPVSRQLDKELRRFLIGFSAV